LDETELFFRFGVALVVGILIGMQREYAFDEPDAELFAGVRTFALMSLTGCAAALVSDLYNSPLPFAAALLIVGTFLTVSYYVDARHGKVGLTTEIAALLTVLAGGLAYSGQIILVVALAVTMALLLSVKLEARRFIEHLTREDIFAVIKFAVVAVIVLPILPNEAFGPPPFDVFNPYTIWLLVVLISGISFVGYILNKTLGASKGIGLTGFLGGLASSTAVTLNFTQRSKTDTHLARPFAFAIIVSWTVMYSRVLVQAVLVNPALLARLWMPVAASVLVGLVYCVYLYFSQRKGQESEKMEFANPFELGPAITFGLLFAVILFITRAAQVYLDDAGVYLSSFIGGIPDVNAITLSMAQLSRNAGGLDTGVAVRAIIIATVSNTLVKGLIVLFAGATPLRKAILPAYILMMITGVVVAFLV
jgi:uncharacterized membrane protein (DUF4010 family)